MGVSSSLSTHRAMLLLAVRRISCRSYLKNAGCQSGCGRATLERATQTPLPLCQVPLDEFNSEGDEKFTVDRLGTPSERLARIDFAAMCICPGISLRAGH